MKNKYPIYIISKGRWEDNLRLTSKALDEINLPYFIVVEQKEYENYCSVINRDKVIVLPEEYIENYDTFWDKTVDKRTGPGAARNFCWNHSVENGFERHWVLDDNIAGFVRLNHNERIPLKTGNFFRAAEDFVDRYENIALAGFDYRFFAGGHRREKAPYRLNVRVYSCLLIRNNIPFRWRGRYNEDSDLSLRVLKSGYCTLLFQAFLCNKIVTQAMEGGNTAEFYSKEGTLNKSKMLEDMHPDMVKVAWRYNRWHHQINYDLVRKNKLIKKPDIEIARGINNYGMVLREVS